jgi:hypothetical protein
MLNQQGGIDLYLIFALFFPERSWLRRIKNNCNKRISKGQYDRGLRKEDKAPKLDKKSQQYFLAASNQ